jgi:thiamine-phosphate pyrophosphorylase
MATLPQLAARARARSGHDLPALFLLSDPVRQPDPAAAMARLARGAGVIYRPGGTAEDAPIARRCARIAKARGLIFVVAGDAGLMQRTGANGFHAPGRLVHRITAARASRKGLLITAAVHNGAEAAQAIRAGADALLVSPVFPTASHPGARTLGTMRFALVAASSPVPVYALGGITAATARRLPYAAGFAAIGAFRERQAE